MSRQRTTFWPVPGNNLHRFRTHWLRASFAKLFSPLRRRVLCGATLAIGLGLSGCTGFSSLREVKETIAESKVPLLDESEVLHSQLNIQEPDVPPAAPEEVAFTQAPRTLDEQGLEQTRNLSLDEAIQLALSNNEIVRTAAAGQPSNILNTPDAVPSIYDPAIQETGVLFGRRGVEAALADFDATFATTMLWGRSEDVQNINFGAGAGFVGVSETGTFQSSLQKAFANGGRATVFNNWNYQGTNNPNSLFPSAYTGAVGVQYRQPLWARAGTEFTRIAGPSTPGFGSITGVSQGVVIARINTDISLADFQRNVRDMVFNVEQTYWDLYLAYCLYDTAVVARNSALESWRLVNTRDQVGRANKDEEPQARDRYYETRAQVETALNDIYRLEASLRQILGMAVNDGSILRPTDEPTTAQIVPDWQISLAEALVNRVELRRQKWSIKSLSLQLKAAESLVNPQLDFVSSYQVNGFGDDLIGGDNLSRGTNFGNAAGTVTDGNLTGWTLGFEFSMPVGFRNAHTQVRNIELQLAKSRKVLAAQELDISHQLGRVFQNISAQYHTAQSNYNRLIAAQKREEVLENLKEGGLELDLWLRAQESVALARRNYCQSVAEYNKALAALHYNKGTSLEHYSIHLSEGGWDPLAQRDALERALQRTNGIEAKHATPEPSPFAAYPAGVADPNAAVRVQNSNFGRSLSPVGDPTIPGEVEENRLPDDAEDPLDIPLDPDLNLDSLEKELQEKLQGGDEGESDLPENPVPAPMPTPNAPEAGRTLPMPFPSIVPTAGYQMPEGTKQPQVQPAVGEATVPDRVTAPTTKPTPKPSTNSGWLPSGGSGGWHATKR